jgi:BirA family transcriptional regulator, biotin operon repressor / biotin---[acetyl-CoA-carboxylase] ligase
MLNPERVLSALSPASRFRDLRFLDEIDSTNRYARDAAAAGAAAGLVVVADFQTAGRGRLDRRWEAASGTALLMSILLRVEDLPPTRFHLVTAAAALSVRDGCAEAGGFSPDLKWPNDLLVDDRKLAGILAESAGPAVVVGIGCNVTDSPPGAVSASDAAGRPVDREALLIGLLDALERWYGRWADVAAEYRATCATIGRAVRVEQAAGAFDGLAEAIDPDGRLVVRRDDGGVVAVAAADVVHLRPRGG